MRTNLLRAAALALLSLGVAGCATRSQTPVAALNDDDDAACRAGGAAAGSAEYVACRRDRDVQRSNATARSDRRQRDLADYMISHPEH